MRIFSVFCLKDVRVFNETLHTSLWYSHTHKGGNVYLKRAIIVHGGAWKIPRDLEKPCLEGVERAAKLALNC